MDGEEVGLFVAVVLVFAGLASAHVVVTHVLGTRHFMVTIISGSMEPALYRGDIVAIRNSAEYAQGDVIAFSPSGNLGDVYVHRIVFIRGNRFITKGDKSAYEDRWEVPPENVLGRVILRIPMLGRVNLWLDGK